MLPIAALTPASFAAALAEINPLQENPLDALAAKLKERLPALFIAVEFASSRLARSSLKFPRTKSEEHREPHGHARNTSMS